MIGLMVNLTNQCITMKTETVGYLTGEVIWMIKISHHLKVFFLQRAPRPESIKPQADASTWYTLFNWIN